MKPYHGKFMFAKAIREATLERCYLLPAVVLPPQMTSVFIHNTNANFKSETGHMATFTANNLVVSVGWLPTSYFLIFHAFGAASVTDSRPG